MKLSDYNTGDMFITGPDWQMNACLGTNGTGRAPEFSVVAEGFLLGARALYQQFTEDYIGDPISPSDRVKLSLIDLVIYPLVYLLRHSAELFIKQLLSQLEAFDKSLSMPSGHKLDFLFADVSTVIVRHFPDRFDSKIFSIKKVLDDFCLIDPGGEAFRYPLDRKGAILLENYPNLNVVSMYESMESVNDELESWVTFLDYELDSLAAERNAMLE